MDDTQILQSLDDWLITETEAAQRKEVHDAEPQLHYDRGRKEALMDVRIAIDLLRKNTGLLVAGQRALPRPSPRQIAPVDDDDS